MNMNKQEIIIDGSVNNNYIRVISFEEWEWDYEKPREIVEKWKENMNN